MHDFFYYHFSFHLFFLSKITLTFMVLQDFTPFFRNYKNLRIFYIYFPKFQKIVLKKGSKNVGPKRSKEKIPFCIILLFKYVTKKSCIFCALFLQKKMQPYFLYIMYIYHMLISTMRRIRRQRRHLRRRRLKRNKSIYPIKRMLLQNYFYKLKYIK